MTNSLRFSIYFLLSSFLLQGSLKAQTLLYKITGKEVKKASYLYGTMHVSDERVFQFNDAVMPAFNKSKAYAMEIVPDVTAIFKLAKLMTMETNLKDLLSAEEYDSLEVYFKERMGMPLEMLQNYYPFYLYSMMYMQIFNQDRPDPLDVHFYNLAKENDKLVYGLESIEEQGELIQEIPLAEQTEMLLDLLNNEAAEIIKTEKLLDYYVKGDLDSLAQMAEESNMGGDFEKDFVLDRNITMTERIQPLIAKTPTFIAVGALHLPGPQGIVALLKKEGYNVTPVE